MKKARYNSEPAHKFYRLATELCGDAMRPSHGDIFNQIEAMAAKYPKNDVPQFLIDDLRAGLRILCEDELRNKVQDSLKK